MKHPKTFPLMTLAVLLMACLWSAAFGQSNDGNLANVVGGGSSVRFEIVAQNAGVTLTITAPDGRSFTREYKAGSSPGFEFGDRSLPDGSYGYELRLRPSLTAGQREALKEARGKDDDPEAERAARKRPVLPNMIQSGAFALINGQVIVGGLGENQRTGKVSVPAVNKSAGSSSNTETGSGNTANRLRNHRRSLLSSFMPDQVIPDDLIVQGSACVGLDCVNGESFGFDTIRLKENNLRIHFDDTSVSVGFPANDWRLIANDSASGGASKFSIEDSTGARTPFTITAGAATNSIFVDSTGRLGLRTSTPVLDIHSNTGNTPALRLEQNNSGGFAAQTWDIGANEANFFVRDVTGGSKLSLRIRPGAPTSSLDIAANGNVGIGTGSPGDKLSIEGSNAGGTVGGYVKNTSGTTANTVSRFSVGQTNTEVAGLLMQFSHNDDNAVVLNRRAGTGTLDVQTTGGGIRIDNSGNVGIATLAPTAKLSVNGTANKPGGGSWDVFSDERLKNIKGQFTPGLSAVMRLQPLRYHYKQNNALSLEADKEYVGFGAQELQKVLPEAVTRNANGFLQVNNDPIIWTMLNAIKEQQKEIEQLKGEIKKLRSAPHRRRR